jgi:4-amino-4-deoxy-L-arabinose transferase-like glycosyltransferase
LVVELSHELVPPRLLPLAAVGLSSTTLALVCWCHRRWIDLGALSVLVLYLINPSVDPRLAEVVAFVAIAGTLLQSCIPSSPRYLDPLIFFVALAGYTMTLAPDVLPHDSGELQLVGPTLDIAHPPGYALYTMLGKIFSIIPLQTPAWRMNLLSAVLAAFTLVVTGRAARELTGSARSALIAVVALAGAASFWATATTANVRMLTALFTALLLWLLLRFARTRSTSTLLMVAFVFGLAVVHHGSLVFMALPVAIFVIGLEPRILTRPGVVLRIVLAFLVSLSVVLYFPIRAMAGHALFDPGGLTTPRGLLQHVLAQGFLDDVLYFSDPAGLLDRLAVLRDILVIQFGWPLVAVAVIGLVPPMWPHRQRQPLLTWVLIVGVIGLISAATITYRAAQTVDYLTPVYVALALAIALGAQRIARVLPLARLEPIVLVACLLPAALNILHAAPSFVALSKNREIRATSEATLRDAPPSSTILADWFWITPLRYLQVVEGLRTDVALEYVVPSDTERYEGTWRQRLVEAFAHGPVIVTNYYESYAGLPFTLSPFHEGFAATNEPLPVPPQATYADVPFGAELQLVASSIDHLAVSPGESLQVRIWWRPLNAEPDRDYSVFLHMIGADGKPLAQDDVRYSAAELRRGQVLLQDSPLTIPADIVPGEYVLRAGVYFASPEGKLERLRTADGEDQMQLGTVQVLSSPAASVFEHPVHKQFAGGPTMKGLDFDTTLSPETRLYVHWQLPALGGPWTETLLKDGRAVASRQLGAVPGGGHVSTAIDVPGNADSLQMTVQDADGHKLGVEQAWYWPVGRSTLAIPSSSVGERSVRLGEEMALAKADVTAAADDVTVSLTWLPLRPILRDYRVSVQIQGAGWLAQDDSAPALGAIPTTKWIADTPVMDRHHINIRERGAGPAEIHVVVYDAFNRSRLPVLDDRFDGQHAPLPIGRLNLDH